MKQFHGQMFRPDGGPEQILSTINARNEIPSFAAIGNDNYSQDGGFVVERTVGTARDFTPSDVGKLLMNEDGQVARITRYISATQVEVDTAYGYSDLALQVASYSENQIPFIGEQVAANGFLRNISDYDMRTYYPRMLLKF